MTRPAASRLPRVFARALPWLLAVALLGCADPVERVRQARLEPNTLFCVGEVLEKYSYFTAVRWSTRVTAEGQRLVEAECDLDVASNCKGVSEAGLVLALRDAGRDYLVVTYVVEGLRGNVRLQSATHVTQCLNGTLLKYSDRKYLQAVYRNEPVRIFCLEGLNCPPAGPEASATP